MVSAQASARKVIEADIEEHVQTIIQLKRRLNTHTEIARLPAEILSEVFLHICRHTYETQQDMLFNATSDTYYLRISPASWIVVAHICHAWREIALSTPRLWSYIVGTQQAYLNELVARSKKAPLHITAAFPLYTPSDGRLQALEQIVTSHTSRLVELYLSASLPMIRDICQKLCDTASAPLLRSLVLCEPLSHHSWNTDSPHILRSLSPQALPALHTLDSRRLKFAWDEPIFSATALTKLVVYGRQDSQDVMGSFESLLIALQGMTFLETLELDDAIPKLPVDITSILPPPRKITLPHLQHLSITSNGPDCANLLGHLFAPKQTIYHLTSRTQPGGPDLATVLKDHLASSEPLRAIRLERRLNMRQVLEGRRVPITEFEARNLYTSPTPSGDVHVDLPMNASFFAPLFNDTIIFHGVQTLEIAVSQDPNRDYPWAWQELFAAMPNIHVLSLGGDQTHALTNALSTPRHDDQGSITRELPLPQLEVLKLRDIRLLSVDADRPPEFMDLLIDCLIARCHYGVPVAELHLKRCRNTLWEDVGRLEEVVADVQWDGIEDMEEEEEELEEDYCFDDYDGIWDGGHDYNGFDEDDYDSWY
ncbi:hypothetical protein C8Q80DRAFT_1195661 [Daedaleopsis nitida]|nr:hypothetical protein C8Q80DRAFT_1195661 [Daedaleopsis nitida]